MIMQPILLLLIPLVHAQSTHFKKLIETWEIIKNTKKLAQNCPGHSLWPPNEELGDKKLLVGFLTYQTDIKFQYGIKRKYGLKIPGAFSWAVETVNNGSILPDGYKMQFEVYDTQGSEIIGSKYVTDLIRRNASAIFGPEKTCHLEGAVAAANNRAMMSYACSNHILDDKTKYPTFARINPSESTIISATIEVLKQYHWKKFSILYDQPYRTAVDLLEAAAKTEKMTINHKEIFISKMCTIFFEESKLSTRIYVYVGDPFHVSDVLTCMTMSHIYPRTSKDTRKDTSKGQNYMLIYLDMLEFKTKKWKDLIWDGSRLNAMYSENRACWEDDTKAFYRGFMVVATQFPKKGHVNKIRKNVLKYDDKEPFCLGNPSDLHRHVPILAAAYLYDSVILYAKVVREIWEEMMNTDRDEDVSVVDVASDGSAIVNRLKNRTYESILGYNMTLDQNVQGKGHYSVYLLDDCKMFNERCSKCLVNIGNYEPQKKYLVKRVVDLSHIRDEPLPHISDEPLPIQKESCGDIQTCISFGITICLIVVIFIYIILYCYGMYKHKSEGLQLKIDFRGLSYNKIEICGTEVPT